MINLSDDFKKYIDYISFLHDLSNDAGVSDQYDYIEMLKNDAKELIAKEVIHSNQIAKTEVAVIGDFSSGKIKLHKLNYRQKFTPCWSWCNNFINYYI